VAYRGGLIKANCGPGFENFLQKKVLDFSPITLIKYVRFSKKIRCWACAQGW